MSRLCPYYSDSGLIWYGWAQVCKDRDVDCTAAVPNDISNIINDYLGHVYEHRGIRTHFVNEISLLRLEDIDVKSLRFICLDGSKRTIDVSTPQDVPPIWTGRGKLYVNCEYIRPASSTAKAWPKDTLPLVKITVDGVWYYCHKELTRHTWEDIREEVTASFRAERRVDTESVNVIFGCGPKLYPGISDDNMARLLE